MMATTSLPCESCMHRFVCKFSIQQPTFCSHYTYGNCSDHITFAKQGNEQTIYPEEWKESEA